MKYTILILILILTSCFNKQSVKTNSQEIKIKHHTKYLIDLPLQVISIEQKDTNCLYSLKDKNTHVYQIIAPCELYNVNDSLYLYVPNIKTKK